MICSLLSNSSDAHTEKRVGLTKMLFCQLNNVSFVH